MYYEEIGELPQSLNESMPKQAQEVYLNAFNNRYEQIEDEQVAHEAAWTAVNEQLGAEDARQWRRKMDQSSMDSTPTPLQPD